MTTKIIHMHPADIYYVKLKGRNSLITVFKWFKYIIHFPFILPHLILVFTSRKKDLILSDAGTVSNAMRSLVFLKHYRNLFYHRIGYISCLISWLLPGESSIVIPFSLKMGRHVNFVHNIGSHLNAHSIGDDFICYQHVVIGARSLSQNHELPKIGNNVTLCTGCVVVGPITIGDNVVIGANAVVSKNVPSNSFVMGNPCIIKTRKE